MGGNGTHVAPGFWCATDAAPGLKPAVPRAVAEDGALRPGGRIVAAAANQVAVDTQVNCQERNQR
jgi:hypothetical protein